MKDLYKDLFAEDASLPMIERNQFVSGVRHSHLHYERFFSMRLEIRQVNDSSV